jgi:hypothetical protein
MIDSFKGPFSFLSNFFPAPIKTKLGIFPTAEHLYQACKTKDHQQQLMIMQLATPAEAKKVGKTLTIREDWDELKIGYMRKTVEYKFMQHWYLMTKLIETNHHKIIEGNWWHDNFWGVCSCERCKGKGLNHLGNILMNLREENTLPF